MNDVTNDCEVDYEFGTFKMVLRNLLTLLVYGCYPALDSEACHQTDVD